MTLSRRVDAKAIERLLRPRSVAIVGASASPGALGATVLANLERFGFTGDIHLINPNRAQIGVRPCLKSVAELPAGIDAAVLAIPHAGVLEAIRDLARRDVGAVVIFSAGFAEGGAAGRAEQQEITRIAAEHGMLIEGPNCLGFVNHADRVALTFVETAWAPLEDRPAIGIVSQSGAMACVLSVMLASRELGVSYCISTGNEAVSGVEDFLDHLLADPYTGIIGLIVEQFRRPLDFLALARRARKLERHLVLLHPGRSNAARESAATHTGALAGDYALMRSKVAGEGVVIVDTLEELGDVLELSVRAKSVPRSGTVIVTESGAFKALALDLAEDTGLTLPVLSDSGAPELRAVIPPFVPVSNPLDLTAQGLVDPDIFKRTLAALAPDQRFGALLLGIIQTDAATADRKFPAIIAALRELRSDKLIALAGLDEGAPVPAQYIRDLRAAGVPYFRSPELAIRAMARLVTAAARAQLEVPRALAVDTSQLPSGVVPEYRAKAILRPLGFPFPAGRLVHTLEEALHEAQSLGYPLALKAQSAALSHKSDAGGVILNLDGPDALAAGWERLHASIASHRPGLVLNGVLLESMGRAGVELIVGGRNDPDWGPVVLAGIGGVQAELLRDFRLIMPGETCESIIEALLSLKGAALLRGFRGAAAVDLRAVAELIVRVGRLLCSAPAIREIDLNPVIAYPSGQGVLALDALILTE